MQNDCLKRCLACEHCPKPPHCGNILCGVSGRPIIDHATTGECPKLPAKGPGLGDMVAAIAQPVAKVIDAAIGTDIAHCSECKNRRERLNQLGGKIGL